jgi:hypothetical protein
LSVQEISIEERAKRRLIEPGKVRRTGTLARRASGSVDAYFLYYLHTKGCHLLFHASAKRLQFGGRRVDTPAALRNNRSA